MMLNAIKFYNNSLTVREKHQKVHTLMIKYFYSAFFLHFRIIEQIHLWQ